MMRKARRLLKRALLGSTETGQKFHMGLRDPQSEVDVWLHGWGDRIDVTHRNFMAGGAPLTIGIGFEAGQIESLSLTDGPHCAFTNMVDSRDFSVK
jgi:hypothetical protein